MMPDRLQNPTPSSTLTRREFVVATCAVGLSLAVEPICAAPTLTDTNGLEAGEVSIPAGDREIPGYRAMPNAGRPFPVVLVAHDIRGAHEHAREVCRRLAKVGYLAVTPDLFIRQGDVSNMEVRRIITAVQVNVPDAQVMSDLDATVAWAQGSGHGDITKTGITGLGWGGRIAWLYAAHYKNLKAAVVWYGWLARRDSLRPKRQSDVVELLNAPLLALYGGTDTAMPLEQVEELRDALKKSGKPGEFVIYPETANYFVDDGHVNFSQEPADDGWKRMLAWFKKYGVS